MGDKFNGLCNKRHKQLRISIDFSSEGTNSLLITANQVVRNEDVLRFLPWQTECVIDLSKATEMVVDQHPIMNFRGVLFYGDGTRVNIEAFR